MSRKAGIVLFILALVTQTVLSGMGLANTAYASGKGKGKGLLTDVELTDEQGNVIDADKNPDAKTAPDTTVHVNYFWSLEDSELSSGEAYSFAVPNELQVQGNQEGKLLAADNTEVGSFQVGTDGKGTVLLQEEAANDPNVQGKFTIKAAFHESIKEAETVAIPFALSSHEKVIQVAFAQDSAAGENNGPDAEDSNNEDAKEGESKSDDDDGADEGADAKENAEEAADKETVNEAETLKTTQAAGRFSAVEIQENMITDFELTMRDGSPLPDPMPNPNENELEMKASYQFALPNDHQYGAGSTFTFQLPEILKVYNQVTGDLGDYGTFEVSTDGTVVLTFNENIEKHSDIEGWVEVYSYIDRELEGSPEKTITVPIQGETTKEVTIHFQPKKGTAIDKRGTPNKKYNAKSIEWVIDFNKDLAVLNNASLDDPIDDPNQKFVPGSIKIYQLEVLLDGSVTQGKEVTNIGNGTFPIDFGDIDKQAYRVVFETEILDEEGTSYKNTANLNWADGSISADATVAVSRGKALEKKASVYDQISQTITWEVKYNYNEKSIPEEQAVLLDELSDNQVFLENTIEVIEVDIDSDTGAELGTNPFMNFTVTKRPDGKNGFKLQFDQDIQKAYKITYNTKAKERVEGGGIEAENKIEANGKTETGSRWMDQQVFNKYHLTKSTDYNEKTTQWRLSINRDKHVMNNVVVKDQLPKGITLDSFTITHGEVAMGDDEYTYTYDEDTNEVTFEFKNPISEEVIIIYNTSFDYNQIEDGKTSFTNEARVTWIAEGETTEREQTDKATFTPNQDTRSNGSKGGSYNAVTKEITWEIGVNYNYREIDNAIVEDIIQNNRTLLLDSIEVYEMNIAPNGNWAKGNQLPADAYTVKEITKGELSGFQLELGKIDSAYVIVFKTSLDGHLIVKEYENEAVLKDGDQEFPLEAKVSVNHGGEYSGKDALQNSENEEILDWKVTINAAQSTIHDARLIDVPSANQILIKDSFVLYGTTVAENGSFTKDETNILEEGKNYTLAFKKDDEGNEYFELSFLKKIDRPYILEYSSFLMAEHGEKVSNNAKVLGKNITTEKTDTQKEITVRYSGGSGGAVGRVGSLEIIKVDAATDKPLEGAEFTLYDKTGTIPLYTANTNAEGKITFEKLRFGEYLLKETGVPEGYISLNPDGELVTVDKDTKNPEEKGNTHQVKNYKLVYAAELTKVDEDDNKVTLAGAEFDLEKKDNGEFTTIQEKLVTNDDGVIYVDDLEPGDYQFVERKAPNGYLLNEEPIPFTIKDQALEVVKVTAVNKAIEKISINGQKSWKDKGNEGDRPNFIEIDLLQNGKVIAAKKVTANDDWSYSFKDLPKTDSKGQAYDYTVKERPVKGYEATTEGYDITNLRVGETSVEGTKTWEDGDYKNRPAEIKIDLLQDGEVVDTVTVTAETDWTYSFTDLEKYDEEGREYVYTVQEHAIEGYESIVSGYDITNQLIYGSVELIKVDADNNELTLEGAVFELRDEDGNVIFEDLTTNADGRIIIEQLAPGNYQFVETKAPEGYEPNPNPVEFTIELGQEKTVTILIENNEKPEKEEPEKPISPKEPEEPGKQDKPGDEKPTDDGKRLPDTATSIFNHGLLGFVILSAGILLAARRKKKIE